MATEMKPKIEQIENLARLHRQTTGNEVDITMLTTKWEDMTILLRSHDQIAKEQMEQLKASLKERVKLFIAKMDKVSFLINALNTLFPLVAGPIKPFYSSRQNGQQESQQMSAV